MEKQEKKFDVIIFGAGPAGLAGAHKLAENNKHVIVFEKDKQVGGISKTIRFKDCYFDLGGHRFFTKSKEVNDLWNKTLENDFLERPRLSRMYYRNKFFSYPVKPFEALLKLGLLESILVGLSYIKSKILPHKEGKNFTQWVSNRFGKRLYLHFFKSYTEKLWGISCEEIQAEWVAQRIKGLSFRTVIKNAFFPTRKSSPKTLIDKFKYPKYGPGMMYEKMEENINKMGCSIAKEVEVLKVFHNNFKVEKIITQNKNKTEEHAASHFLSSMPITALIKKLSPAAPKNVLEAANNLKYRSFITVSVILNSTDPFPDTWIYIHSPEVKMGRIQNFKKWSPYMVENKNKTALGLEYFCTENDDFWKMKDEDLISLGLTELEKIKLGRKIDFIDGFVTRVSKAYPIYDSTYKQNIEIVRDYLDRFFNLQPIGRYGMFKYNNMDHSILTGLYAAKNILGDSHDIWTINADKDYHEEKTN